jgi:MinD superfamily P-loop ATPase
MQKAYVEPEKCLCCPKCFAVRASPIKAIFIISNEDPAVVDPRLCHGCGDCVDKCIGKAIVLKNG